MEVSLLSLKVACKTAQAQDIYSFELVHPDGAPLPAFTAGAHIDIHGPSGLVRQYSLCNPCGDTARYEIGVLRDANSRGGSVAMHALQVGDLVRVSSPRNLFALDPSAKRSLLFAGGIGITPILCMADSLARQGQDFSLHYCTRSRELTAFRDRIASSPFSGQVAFHFDDGEPAQKLDAPALLRQPDPDTHIYVCGPAGFLDYVRGAAQAQGWPSGNIHFEYFAAQAVVIEGDDSFDVEIASTGKVYTVAPDRSVAATLAESGITIPLSCEQGVCGTCVTRVLGGVPDHRDYFLTEDERARNDQFTPCCSRSKSALLILDL